MKNKLGTFFMILGALLIAGAIALFLCNREEAFEAGEASKALLPDVVNVIKQKAAEDSKTPQNSVAPHVDPFNEQEVLESYEMNTVTIDGNEYIGYMALPTINIELPVMSDWSYSKLKIAPCRQFGSVKGCDLVIAGHNYPRHFGNIYKLKKDDIMTFTDVDGNVTVYNLLAVEQIEATDVAGMKEGEWDLTLYTCTYGGANRIAARFRKADNG